LWRPWGLWRWSVRHGESRPWQRAEQGGGGLPAGPALKTLLPARNSQASRRRRCSARRAACGPRLWRAWWAPPRPRACTRRARGGHPCERRVGFDRDSVSFWQLAARTAGAPRPAMELRRSWLAGTPCRVVRAQKKQAQFLQRPAAARVSSTAWRVHVQQNSRGACVTTLGFQISLGRYGRFMGNTFDRASRDFVHPQRPPRLLLHAGGLAEHTYPRRRAAHGYCAAVIAGLG
jgi:hypothetical protein